MLAGPCCFSGPVGALTSIWVWARAGDEIEKAQAGEGPPWAEAGARSIRNQAFGLMVLSMISLTLQCAGFSALGASRETVQSLSDWVTQTLTAVLPEEGLSTTTEVAGSIGAFLLFTAVLGAVNSVVRRLAERAVFGANSPRARAPRKPLPPVPHDQMQAYVDKELALRAGHPEAVVVHPELGATEDEQRYTTGEWAFTAAEVALLPEGLTFLAVVLPRPEGPPEVLWREPRAVLRLLGPRVKRRTQPCVHLFVALPADDQPGLLAELRKLPETKP